MTDLEEYVITPVPSDHLAGSLRIQQGASERLASAVFEMITDKGRSRFEKLLCTTRRKAKLQRECHGDAQRHRNIDGLYSVACSERVQDRDIVLIDDVVTSGATLEQCAWLLRLAKAKSVTLVALARTVRKPWWPFE